MLYLLYLGFYSAMKKFCFNKKKSINKLLSTLFELQNLVKCAFCIRFSKVKNCHLVFCFYIYTKSTFI